MKTREETLKELSFWLKTKEEISKEEKPLTKIGIISSGNTRNYIEGKISALEWVLN